MQAVSRGVGAIATHHLVTAPLFSARAYHSSADSQRVSTRGVSQDGYDANTFESATAHTRHAAGRTQAGMSIAFQSREWIDALAPPSGLVQEAAADLAARPTCISKDLDSQPWVVAPSRDRRRVTHQSFASRNKQVLVYILPFQALTRPLNAAKIWTTLFWAAHSGLGLDLGLGLRQPRHNAHSAHNPVASAKVAPLHLCLLASPGHGLLFQAPSSFL
ncbi:hypothetical protein EDB80DRAFT_774604 [Ilyonectria destructans]|nr:hypothetical protein EDB80DRAFT_774604 [Ilyonectria destructans]